MKFTKKNAINFLKTKGYEIKSIEGGYIGEDELCNNSSAYCNIQKYRDGLTKGMDGMWYRGDEVVVYAYCVKFTNGLVLFDYFQDIENWEETMLDQIDNNN